MSRRENVMKYFDEQRAENALFVAEGIEKNRKGDFSLVFESDGALPRDITVEAELKNHEFKFGANIFMLDEFNDEYKNKTYREKFPELFNLATLPFYWSANEPERGNYRFDKNSPKMYRRPAIDLCLEYCAEQGIEPKLHCLNYDAFTPNWIKDASVHEMKAALTERFRVISKRYADKIPSLEVTNETLQSSHKSAFFMEDDLLEWSYTEADKFFPNNRLIINDYNIWDPTSHNRNYYYMQIERLLRNGISHLDTIGMQFHCFFPEEAEASRAYQRFNPRRLRELFDLFSKFGKNLQITEMTIPARSEKEEDEDLQAELTTELYKLFFSYPSMDAIIYWNLVDGYAYLPNGGEPGDMTKGENVYYGSFLRYDMTEKPVYRELKKLIREEWHTRETVKAQSGRASFRGFYGDYDLKIHFDGKCIPVKIKTSKNGDNVFTIKI